MTLHKRIKKIFENNTHPQTNIKKQKETIKNKEQSNNNCKPITVAQCKDCSNDEYSLVHLIY